MKKYCSIIFLLTLLLTFPNAGIFAQTKKSDKPITTKEQVSKKPSAASKNPKTAVSKKTKKKKKAIQKEQPNITAKTGVAKNEHPETFICSDSLIARAKARLGIPYKYASCEPSAGFDCSGFVYNTFGQFNVKVPRSSIDYGDLKSSVPSDSARIGDIIVFTGTNAGNRRAGHVGIVVSNPGEELTFIHSSSNKKHGGVIISTYKSSPYYEKRFIKIVRLENVEIGKCAETQW